MYNALTVSPAYGRDYTSATAVKADWTAGKDFVIQDMLEAGRYVNNADIAHYGKGYTHLHIRYAKMTKILVIKL